MSGVGREAPDPRVVRARRRVLALVGAVGVASVALAVRGAVHGFWLDLTVFLVLTVGMVCLAVTLLRRKP